MAKVEFAPTAHVTPPNPSKFDIIPIHNSDRASFKFCRRQWAWSSPSRLNLIPKAYVHGINKNFWFGNGIHHALEKYYSPTLREDPVVAFETWFNLQWLGGIVTDDEVKEFADRDPVLLRSEPLTQSDADGNIVWEGYPPDTYKVSGLVDILPNPDEDEFLGYLDTGKGMLNFYKGYAEEHDNFRVVSVEHDFSVPVLDGTGAPLYAVDKRKIPDGWEPDFDSGNEFGPYMKMVTAPNGPFDSSVGWVKQVHVRGRMDQVQQSLEHGRYGIMDYKTASVIGEDYFRHLELDEQCTSYLTFGQIEARLNGLEYKDLEYITYQAMLKAYPKPPTLTTKGIPSINRQTESTTAKMFEECIMNMGLKPMFDVDPKMQAYYQWLLELGDKHFVHREPAWRNKIQRQNAMVRCYYEALDMLNDPVAYPNPTKNYSCLNCAFRGPCIAAEDGGDWKAMLEDGYQGNWDR